jgi:hypothetical protein
MRAHLLFLVAAFDADLATDGAPTFDPEEMEISLLDEYASDDSVAETRFLQFVGNATNITIPPPAPSGMPLVPMVLVALGGVGAAGYFMTRPGPSYETYEYTEDGLLEEEYDEYDEEYEEYEEDYYE